VVVIRLVRNTIGLFIWAGTLIGSFGKCHSHRRGCAHLLRAQLLLLSQKSSSIRSTSHSYSLSILPTRKKINKGCSTCWPLFSGVLLSDSPLSTNSLCGLLYIRKQEFGQALKGLHAFLDIPKGQALPLRLHNRSFRDPNPCPPY
jgi:hypothetical protein